MKQNREKNISKDKIEKLTFLFNQGKLLKLIKEAKQLILKYPNSIFLWNILGASNARLKKLSESEKCFYTSIKLNPNFIEGHYNLGKTQKELGKLTEALLSYKKAIEIKPDFAEAYYNLGVIKEYFGRSNEAIDIYKKAIELKPDYAEAYNNLANRLNKLGNLEEAEINYKKAIELKPNYANALISRGQFFFENGKFEASLRDFDTISTVDSRSRALVSLYALGKIDEIYNRIEANSELDDENISVAAFSSFITAKEGKDTANKFCNNPMDFIHFSNLSSHLKNSNSFINEVIEELHNVKTIWEPTNKTTYKGFQSMSNLFENPLGKLSNLKSIITDELDLYYLKFKKESCSYIKKWPSKKELFAWHVILKKQGYQNAHIHPSGWLSGVIYLKVVPPLEKNEGAIEFSLNGQHYSDISSPKKIYKPKLGDIVFFPSSLHHRTIPFSTDTDRIIISFDLGPDSFNNKK